MPDNDLLAARQAELERLREQGWNYPNDFRPDELAARLHEQFGALDTQRLEREDKQVRVAGRMVSRRVMGKAAFMHLQDYSGRIQLYLRHDQLPEGLYEQAQRWDLGDILGVRGKLFKTRTGELSLHAEELHLLSKSLRPLPEKYHGLANQEQCYRQRYLDLIANKESRRIFNIRVKTVDLLRQDLKKEGFVEVETPMMHPLPGGATARPFVTHHNSLHQDLYLRIAPELYLKRLLIGGMDRIFELNRNFRNEGLSTRHNPEFTMLEFYQAYADYRDLMKLVERLLRSLAMQLHGTTQLDTKRIQCDLAAPFQRMTMREAILHCNKDLREADLLSLEKIQEIARRKEVTIPAQAGRGAIECALFEKTAEASLQLPTFITAYPIEVSPLARCNDENPDLADRFEFFLGGCEIANGFSELNDPGEQTRRFQQQIQRQQVGDEEAMRYDVDFLTALEYGMPPAAGAGIGIDRLVMMLSGAASIRDVILFPQLKQK